jgi:hypothetical protein
MGCGWPGRTFVVNVDKKQFGVLRFLEPLDKSPDPDG